ncbi:MAG: hypothetical protein QT05_C0049G0024 [archaeon GW2011_AR13]|nr:MAG: hypothetical protein QT05_C0049G0024 [archaeon GW2011_AR13]HIG94514.1 hypothetical protein [Nanoarchaeota archaeon]HIH63049.1 hypothetical protein [Nanoarchaeota archaeon]HIJ09524.1 hypothetical protein [Nanoarchaeota archaeon]
MRAFFGGQIQENHRGELATVITRQNKEESYNVFLYPILSEEFVYLTGVGDVKYPVERAYIGVSHDIGEEIARQVNGKHIDTVNLRTIDKLVVMPHFLDKSPEKPKQIILQSTKDGYEILP